MVSLQALRNENERIRQWREKCLLEAGYSVSAAILLAGAERVDLHDAIAMLKAGCSEDLALEILL